MRHPGELRGNFERSRVQLGIVDGERHEPDALRLVGVDVDLYIGGELLATSKPELVASGLLGSRASPAAQREIVRSPRGRDTVTSAIGRSHSGREMGMRATSQARSTPEASTPRRRKLSSPASIG